MFDRDFNRADFGSKDESGHWKPPYSCNYGPLFSRKFEPKRILKFIFGWGGFLYPGPIFFILLASATYFLLRNDIENFNGLSFGFVGFMLVRNLIMAIVAYGALYLLLYKLKVEGTHKKYHPEWSHKDSEKFMFNNQLKDNVFRTLGIGVPVWTAYEIIYIVLYTKKVIPIINFATNPIWFIISLLLIPLIRETHFYFIHKILHTSWLMKNVHIKHHINVNITPWSGMAMHPLETIGYLSVILVTCILPSHPIHMFYYAQNAALAPASGHTGFEPPILKGWLPAGQYFHYLHHKYVSCNFGGPTIPWDKWFGIYYNGNGKFKYQKVKVINLKNKNISN